MAAVRLRGIVVAVLLLAPLFAVPPVGAAAPGKPTNLEPGVAASTSYTGAGEKLSTDSPTLTWNAPSTGADKYGVYVSKGPAFSTLVVDDESVFGTSLTVNLDCGSTYRWNIRAYTSAGGWGDFTPNPDRMYFTTEDCPVQAPGKPTNLEPGDQAPATATSTNGEHLSTSSPTLSWSAPSGGADKYGVYVSEAPYSGGLAIDNENVAGTSLATSLDCGTTYRWNIRAYTNAGGWGELAPNPDRVYFTTEDCPVQAPGKPTNLQPGDPASTSYTGTGEKLSTDSPTLTWNAPSSGADKYGVYVSKGPTFSTLVVDDESVFGTSLTVNLDCGSTYRWNIRAYTNAGGWGDFTPNPDRRYFTTKTCDTSPPPAPSLSSVSPTSYVADESNQQMTLKGSNFASTNTIEYTSPSGQTYSSTDHPHKFTYVSSSELRYGFNPGTEAGTWKVRVIDSDGQQSSQKSFTVTAVTDSNEPPTCSRNSPSQGVSLQTNEQQSFSVTCNDPEGKWLGNAWNLDGAPQGDSDSPPSSTSWTFSRSFSFPNAGTYSLMVGAVDDEDQQSNFISWSITVTAPNQPPPPSDLPPTCSLKSPAQGVSLRVDQEQTFTATCYDEEGEWDSDVWAMDGAAYGGSATPPASQDWTTSRTLSWPSAGTYTLTMAALDAEGQASDAVTWSISVTNDQPSATVPGAPIDLSATASDGRVDLAWSAPSSDGGSSVTSYRVFRGTTSASASLVTSGGCANLDVIFACTDTGLTPGQTYYYIVRAVNSEGQGAISSEASATPTAPTTTPTIPDAPTGLTATATSSALELTWNSPTNTGGADITGYKIYRKIADTSWTGDAQIASSTSTSYSDTTAACGKSYTYDVKAVNSAGDSAEYSNDATATMSACATTTPPTSDDSTYVPRDPVFGDRPANYATCNADPPNHGTNPRDMSRVNAIVIHFTGRDTDTRESVSNYLACNSDRLSAHYVVDDARTITPIVPPDRTAYHATYYNPRSIGIEIVGDNTPSNWGFDDHRAKYETLADLVRWLGKEYDTIPLVRGEGRASGYSATAGPNCVATSKEGVCAGHYDVPLDVKGIVGHYQVQPDPDTADRECRTFTPPFRCDPGPYFDWPQFMTLVSADGGDPPSAPSTESPWEPAEQATVDPSLQDPPSAEPVRSGTGYFFIHGICSRGAMWTEPLDIHGKPNHGYTVWDSLTGDGSPYMAPTYGGDRDPDVQTPDLMMEDLRKKLDGFIHNTASPGGSERTTDGKTTLLNHPLSKVVLIGHSNGGLMARWLATDDTLKKYVDRVVTIDSPDLGVDKNPAEYRILSREFGIIGGDCQQSWVQYTKDYLDRDGKPGVAWMKVPGRLATDSTKIIRFVFGACWASLPAPYCENGNNAVQRDDASMSEAILLAFMASPSSTYVQYALEEACRPGGTGENDAQILAAGVRSGSTESVDQGLLDFYHVWGIEHYEPFITAAAKYGIAGMERMPDPENVYEFEDCRMARAVEQEQILGTVTMSVDASDSGGLAPIHSDLYDEEAAVEVTTVGSRVTVKVSSSATAGKTLVTNLDSNMLGIEGPEDVGVLLDGQSLAWASDYEDVLDATNDDDEGEYLVLAGATGFQVLVSVPHFSERTIEIFNDRPTPTSVPVASGSSPLGGILAGAAILLVGLAGATLFIRSRTRMGAGRENDQHEQWKDVDEDWIDVPAAAAVPPRDEWKEVEDDDAASQPGSQRDANPDRQQEAVTRGDAWPDGITDGEPAIDAARQQERHEHRAPEQADEWPDARDETDVADGKTEGQADNWKSADDEGERPDGAPSKARTLVEDREEGGAVYDDWETIDEQAADPEDDDGWVVVEDDAPDDPSAGRGR